MKHGKLIGLQTDIERLARVAVAAYDAATAPQTAPSGSISLDNADGTRTIIGPQAGSGDGAPSGQAMATHVGDTTPPPVPTGITAWSGDGSLHVMWDGTLSGGIPADFDHISILVDGKEVAQLSSAGSVTIGGVEAGATVSVTATAEDDACLADGTPAHNVSVPCTAIVVEIRDVAEEVRAKADAHAGQIEAIQEDIEAYKKSATATYATKTEVDEKTGAITRTLTADYTKTADLAATDAVKDAKKAGTDAQGSLSAYKASNDKAVADAKKAGTDAQSQLAGYKTSVEETYAEKTELTEAVNQLSSTMTSNYSAFTTYRTSNDTAVSKAQTDATNAQSTIDSYKTSNDQAVADAKAAGTTAQNQLSSYKSSNDAAVKDAKKAGTDAQADLNSYKGTTNQRLDELKNIADNAIESWYLKGAPTASNPPASTWTTDALKKQHAGDLYMDTDTGYSYRWSGTEWVQVKDSDVTKALREIAGIKTDYATKSELKATDTELSGKVSDALTTAKSYTDSSVEQEVTARNAAIKAQADSISLDVSRTYTKSETFSAYQTDADGRIATANANASTAVSTAKTAASDAATAKTNASTAVSTANAAKSTAQTASTNASNAVSTANSANSKSDSAVSTANSASSTANAAKSTVDGMKLGGRNLLKGTSMDVVTGAYPSSSYKNYLSYTTIDVADGDTYTLSFDAKSTHAGDILLCFFYSPNTTLTGVSSTGVKFDYPDGYLQVKLTADWQRYWCTWTQSATAKQKTVIPFRCQSGNGTGTVSMRGVKLEAGNKATDWTPAPEDTDSAVADAKKAGTDAQSSADRAQGTADDAWSRTLRVQVSSAPADAAGDTSRLTATVWRGGELLTDDAVARMGLLAWYVGGRRVATGGTYTCAAGTAAECRLEA